MTKDEIVDMLAAVDFQFFGKQDWDIFDKYEAFVKLVAEKERAPQRTWVGLTDDEVQNIVDCGRPTVVNIRKAEQLLKDKNI